MKRIKKACPTCGKTYINTEQEFCQDCETMLEPYAEYYQRTVVLSDMQQHYLKKWKRKIIKKAIAFLVSGLSLIVAIIGIKYMVTDNASAMSIRLSLCGFLGMVVGTFNIYLQTIMGVIYEARLLRSGIEADYLLSDFLYFLTCILQPRDYNKKTP